MSLFELWLWMIARLREPCPPRQYVVAVTASIAARGGAWRTYRVCIRRVSGVYPARIDSRRSLTERVSDATANLYASTVESMRVDHLSSAYRTRRNPACRRAARSAPAEVRAPPRFRRAAPPLAFDLAQCERRRHACSPAKSAKADRRQGRAEGHRGWRRPAQRGSPAGHEGRPLGSLALPN